MSTSLGPIFNANLDMDMSAVNCIADASRYKRLTIIVATWNAARTLERCIASISEQTFRDWELLIADGGSTDGTIDIIISNSNIISWWDSSKDEGIYDAWNRALLRAKGEYICFLGADDALHSSEALKDLFSAIGNGCFDLVTSLAQLRDKEWEVRGLIGSSWGEAGLPRHMNICHPGLLHHHSLFGKYGVFDTRYKIAADLDLLLRLPVTVTTRHVPIVSVDVQDDGISRLKFWERIRERRLVHSRSARVGPMRAWVFWLDKVWRRPIALALRLPH